MEIGGKCQHGCLWCVFYRFSLIFFAKYDQFSLRNMRTKFCEAAPSRCKVVCCVAIRGEVQHGNFWCVSNWFSLIFFANYDLFSLQNMPMKFREATLSHCEVVWKLVENVSMAFYGAFLIDFL